MFFLIGIHEIASLSSALLSFLNQSFTKCKLLEFKNFESLVFDVFLSKTQKMVVFLQALLRQPDRYPLPSASADG